MGYGLDSEVADDELDQLLATLDRWHRSANATAAMQVSLSLPRQPGATVQETPCNTPASPQQTAQRSVPH